jgi:hypothetical protein
MSDSNRGDLIMLETGNWIIFSYRVPSEPSTLRVRAWRILKRVGALALQQSVYVVPNVPQATRKLRQLRDLIEENGGDAVWLDVAEFTQWSAEWLITRFNEERSQEYSDFMRACAEFNFYATVSESQTRLEQLRKEFRKLRARDYFDCAKFGLASASLADVARKVEQNLHSS